MKTETSEKKSFYRFLLIILASGIGGGVLAAITCRIDAYAVLEQLRNSMDTLAVLVPAVTVLVNVVLLATFAFHYTKAKKRYSVMEEDDEEAQDSVDKSLSFALMPGTICLILNFALFSIGCELSMQPELNIVQCSVVIMTALAGMLLGLVWIIASQNAVIKFIKRMNPEKRGSVFDMNFQKQWADSSDEGELLITYKAGYKAFRTTGITCSFLWLVCMLAQVTFHTGFFPALCVCVLYLVLNVSYMMEAMRLEHGKK